MINNENNHNNVRAMRSYSDKQQTCPSVFCLKSKQSQKRAFPGREGGTTKS